MFKYKLDYSHETGAQMLPRKDGRWYSVKDVDSELATLRAENERLREALVRLEKIGDKAPVDIGLVALISKEALK